MFHFKSGPRRDCDDAAHHDRRHARDDFLSGHGHGFGPHGRGFGRDHGLGRGGRLGRLFAHGDLRLVILSLIADKPRHGYELIKAIEDMVGGAYSPSPGTIYPALTLLEEQGLIAVGASEGAKKLYAITEEGERHLAQNRPVLDTLLTRLAQVGAARGGETAPPIVRAVENLKLALRLRLTQGPLSEDQVRAVAEALDRAARDIERS